jgi:transposase
VSEFDAFSREELVALVLEFRARIIALEAEIERLRKDPPSGTARAVPSFVKPNRPKEEKRERKKRSSSFVRRREEPTDVVEHRPVACPDCGRKLTGGWVHSAPQVIEIPPIRYQVIEHRVYRCRCGVCGKQVLGSADLGDVVIGEGRIGVRLAALIAYLRKACRMPIRGIARLLHAQYGLTISIGEIVSVLHRVAKKGRAFYEELLRSVQSSESVNVDETGFRENGRNGYAWVFCTDRTRYFIRSPGRAGAVAQEVLGSDFRGVLGSDFYSGYHWYLGPHQYCWVHFLRDLHALGEAHPSDEKLKKWADTVKRVYEQARSFRSDHPAKRRRQRFLFQRRLERLAERFAGKDLPQRVLAQRILRFLPHLFVFVERPDVSPDNNVSERALRPLVVTRKVSGGSRSENGSTTWMILMSLFETWSLRGYDALDACTHMLTGQPHTSPN